MHARMLRLTAILGLVLGLVALAVPATADRPTMRQMANFPTGATNSDMAFWGDTAYVGNYGGFRIFDISATIPKLVTDFSCFGPQNDISVWDADGDGAADLLFASVDSVLTGPECGAEVAEDPQDPSAWEGIRVFDISDPSDPVLITGVYQDCGSHTHTLYPDPANNRVLLYNASYSLRVGPTCGPNTGPPAGRDPLHGVIQVVEVPLDDPAGAHEIAEPPINYPGDPDNLFDPVEHGLPPAFLPLRACHDIAVFVELGLAAGACAEQAQLWNIGADGIPDTANPVWVFDDPVDDNGATGDPADPEVAVDFWHSATFSTDGSVVNFIDESFGSGCPPVSAIGSDMPNSDTGRMFFLDTATGDKLSHFMSPRTESALDEDGNETAYCSAHLGNTVPARDRDLLVNAWYMGGVSVIDFTDPAAPAEIAVFDAGPAGPEGSDNWSAYWYETAPAPQGANLAVFGNDGVHSAATGRGFQAFKALVGPTHRAGLDHLNPQTQEHVLRP